MSDRRRGGSAARACVLAVVATACGFGPAIAGDATTRARLPGLATGRPVSVETVFFANPRRAPVRLVRGLRRQTPAMPQPQSTQIVSFGNGTTERVRVVRGGEGIPTNLSGQAHPAAQTGIEKVSFADPQQKPVIVMRGIAPGLYGDQAAASVIDLFGPADVGELNRLAFGVEGVESRHGADLGMWRPQPMGPQGPMQISAAAAFDVGGGDRFDLRQNRLLGRAYLAQLFRRYGNWTDAVAAYNWGPGNMDLWIAGGRSADRLPLDVVRYVALVLRGALIAAAAGL